MTSNRQTLDSYERHVPEYVAGTAKILSGAEKTWIDAVLSRLPQTSQILEIGSGPGRDAEYIRKSGFNVTCTDAAVAFVERLEKSGKPARLLNVLSDPLPLGFNLILANSVLLHFTRAEFEVITQKVYGALRNGGLFAFSLKRGDGEDWSNHKLNAPRYFCYWQPDEVAAQLSQAGFSECAIDTATTERKHSEWMYVIARK